jgi:hypothetical protein
MSHVFGSVIRIILDTLSGMLVVTNLSKLIYLQLFVYCGFAAVISFNMP